MGKPNTTAAELQQILAGDLQLGGDAPVRGAVDRPEGWPKDVLEPVVFMVENDQGVTTPTIAMFAPAGIEDHDFDNRYLLFHDPDGEGFIAMKTTEAVEMYQHELFRPLNAAMDEYRSQVRQGLQEEAPATEARFAALREQVSAYAAVLDSHKVTETKDVQVVTVDAEGKPKPLWLDDEETQPYTRPQTVVMAPAVIIDEGELGNVALLDVQDYDVPERAPSMYVAETPDRNAIDRNVTQPPEVAQPKVAEVVEQPEKPKSAPTLNLRRAAPVTVDTAAAAADVEPAAGDAPRPGEEGYVSDFDIEAVRPAIPTASSAVDIQVEGQESFMNTMIDMYRGAEQQGAMEQYQAYMGYKITLDTAVQVLESAGVNMAGVVAYGAEGEITIDVDALPSEASGIKDEFEAIRDALNQLPPGNEVAREAGMPAPN